MYVDAILDRKNDKIEVVERVNGQRYSKTLPVPYVFYAEHPSGSFRTIFDEPCKRFTFTKESKFQTALDVALGFKGAFGKKPGKPKRVFESDINPIFRALANEYTGVDAPSLHIAFFDIEADFDPVRGYAPTDDPFNAVTAISVYCKWLGELFTLALCPPSMTLDEAKAVGEKFENTIIYDDEKQLLSDFLDLIEDADVLSGWNSEGYDIPYLVNRVKMLLGADYTAKFCLFGRQPRERVYEKFKKKFQTYDLVGRVHLDYLLLYQKHNPQQLHSYRLDAVGEIEVKENKVPYDGTLDALYKNDFEQFIAYSRQDTALLNKIDEKKKFIELANQIAHANCVLLKTTVGSVALVEQAIINDMHAMGFVVRDRRSTTAHYDEARAAKLKTSKRMYKAPPTKEELDAADEDEDQDDVGRTPVCGAYVADPKTGEHEHVACCDINSLYPSAIRALNMSPETVFGQFRQDMTTAYITKKVAELGPKKRAEAWEGLFSCLEYKAIFEKTDDLLTLDFEDPNRPPKTMRACEWYDFIWDPANQVCITANGTVFSTRKDGMIPMLLARWYADRKTMQGKQKDFEKLAKAETDPEKLAEYKFMAGFWNQRQQARKILLNSLYGALLNEGLRFYDERLGQSVTLTGRTIVRHMNSKANEEITGVYDYKGDAIVYADTDSCYFSGYEVIKKAADFNPADWDRDTILAWYDDIADKVNESFPAFMDKTFNTGLQRGGVIAAGRELAASKALFIKKKKYACLMYDYDGFRQDVDGKPGKLKVMGLDLKRADTPKFMQQFLEKLLMDFLTNVPQSDLYEAIRKFRVEFKQRPSWEKGTPKKVNGIEGFTEAEKAARGRRMTDGAFKANKRGKSTGKIDMPGHVRASINWNRMRDDEGDKYSLPVTDGGKVIVCKLKPNVFQMDSIAYPIDELRLPEWFRDLPFDDALMEETIIDAKLDNLFGILTDWDVHQSKDRAAVDIFGF